jgi:hypothetical protein
MEILHGDEQAIAMARSNILIECQSELQDPMATSLGCRVQRNTIAIPSERRGGASVITGYPVPYPSQSLVRPPPPRQLSCLRASAREQLMAGS